MWYFEIVDIVDFVDFVDFLKTSEKELKKHLFFLFKVYYSPMVDYCRERERINYIVMRNFNNNNNNNNINNLNII